MDRTLRGIAGLLSMLSGLGLALFVPYSAHIHDAPIDFDWHFIALIVVLLGLGYLLLGGNAQHLVDVVKTLKGDFRARRERRRR